MSYLGWVAFALSVLVGLYVHIVSQPAALQFDRERLNAQATQLAQLNIPRPTPTPCPLVGPTRRC